MKLNLLCSAVLVTMFSVSANAQDCAGPVTTWHPDATGTPTLTGNTCDVGSELGIISLCESGADAHGHAFVALITPQAAGTFTTISLTNSGFTGYMAVVATNAATPCNGSGDTGHCTTAGDTATPITHAALTDAQAYYLIVSNALNDAPTACGPFTLTANGTLPVTLQNFTVS